jgi:hypothetical protein
MKTAFYSGAALGFSFLAGGLIWLHDPMGAVLAFAAAVLSQVAAIDRALRVMTDDVLTASRQLDALAKEAAHD